MLPVGAAERAIGSSESELPVGSTKRAADPADKKSIDTRIEDLFVRAAFSRIYHCASE